MNDWLIRSEMLLGTRALANLAQAHVLVVGLGGVGGAALEHLVWAGIGKLTIVDGDIVQPSNRNRQILALCSTTEMPKAQVAAARCRDINPEVEIVVVEKYLTAEEFSQIFDAQVFDYVIDAIDTLAPKISLISECFRRKIPLVSAMGAGGKRNPALVSVADISKTHHDNLAHALRKRLHKQGIYKGFKAVFSSEEMQGEMLVVDGERNKRSNVGTISYMPHLFGLWCAYTVIDDLINS